ncbi:hypothetical protein GCM10023187_52250 [Nibrella viscosa]|uniref:Peptidase S8/S53 domain-containing protein n=2 Tax=Nibrella viscosa TaxID=1084524 RepID=A0ABP8KYG3_9BACT
MILKERKLRKRKIEKAKRKKKKLILEDPKWYEIIITVRTNSDHKDDERHERVVHLINQILKRTENKNRFNENEVVPHLTKRHLFARLQADTIIKLVLADNAEKEYNKVVKEIWPDFTINPLLNKSVKTINADLNEKGAKDLGVGITWAVLDSGIHSAILKQTDRNASQGHRHFITHANMHSNDLYHRDFTVNGSLTVRQNSELPFVDDAGHGTHVAGIIAGASGPRVGGVIDNPPIKAYENKIELEPFNDNVDEEQNGDVKLIPVQVNGLFGVAPQCKLVSLKILKGNNTGKTRSLLAAITHVRNINLQYPNDKIHGINISVGYPFKAKWFSCGQSPVCVELNELVKETNVIVVVAAGNSGYGRIAKEDDGIFMNGVPITINDPGNAQEVITVGSSHREDPVSYGVSFFSSKGPTSDGRIKPDLVAPGENIISCAVGKVCQDAEAKLKMDFLGVDYISLSGTSMAAPHVSGAIAAFLSKRRNYINKPAKEIKMLFMDTATSLPDRDRCFQGAGLVNLEAALNKTKS